MKRTALILFALAAMCGGAQAAPPACAALQSQMAKAAAGPVFLASYPTAQIMPLKGNAYLYDNAVAAIALIGCGDAKDAARIGDAVVFALHNDPVWHDGRLRNAYQSGAAGTKPAKVAGWWDAKQNKWVEDAYQVGSDTGNQAWAMLALLALYRANHNARYRDAALQIAKWVEKSYDPRVPPGFDGGTFGDQPNSKINRWKSTEHNTDLFAAFTQLAAATGDAHWKTRADIARGFVLAMWNSKCACFDAGMAEDGKTHNTTLALDAQVWPLTAGIGQQHVAVLGTTRARIAVGGGYAYGASKGGVWTEGTAQMALLQKLMGRDAAPLLSAVEKNRAPGGSYFATDVASLSSGFDMDTDVTQKRPYFHLPHLVALAWVVLAQTGFNPFTGDKVLPR